MDQLFNDVKQNDVGLLIKHSENILANMMKTNYKIPKINPIGFPISGLSLVHVAAYYDSLECLQYLIKMGLSPEIKSGFGYDPLHYAVYGCAEECATYLLAEQGVNPNTCPPHSGLTPMFLSVDSPSILSTLIDFGAVFDRNTSEGKDPVIQAVQKGQYESFKILVEKAKLNTSGNYKDCTALTLAIINMNFKAIDPLIKLGARINYRNKEGDNALCHACNFGYEEVVDKLIENGADVNIRGPNNKTPLFFAAVSANCKIIKSLFNAGADPTLVDKNGNNPLFSLFMSKDYLEAMKLLVEHGIDINHKTENGTILAKMLANKETPTEYIEFALQHGADLFEKAKNGKTCYQIGILCQRNNKETIAVIKKYAEIQKQKQH